MVRRNLLIGRAGTGKTRRLLDRVAKAAGGDDKGSCLLLVPTHSQAGHLKRLLISRYPGVTGFFDESIVTFTSLAERIVPGQTISGLLSGLRQRLLVRRALLDMSLPHFRAVSGYPGFHRAAIEFLKEVKQNGLPPAEQEERLRDIAASNSSPGRERILAFHEFYVIYEQRRRTLGLLDHEDFLAEARDLLQEGRGPALDYLGVDGFQNFTRLEREILLALSGCARETEVTLACDPDRPEDGGRQFRVSTETYRFLGEHGFRVRRLRRNHRAGNATLAGLEAALLHERPAGFAPNSALRVLVASDPEDEADRVARTVRALLLDGGVRRRDVLIVARDAAECQRRFTAAFARHAIPLRVFAPRSVAGHAFCRSAVALLRLRAGDLRRSLLISLLRSGRVPRVELPEVDRLEEDLDRFGEPSGAAGWIERVRGFSGAGARALEALAIAEEPAALRTRGAFASDARELISGHLSPRLDESECGAEMVRSEAFAYRCLQSVLAEIAGVPDTEAIGCSQFLGELEEALRSTLFTPRDLRLDVVNLVGAREARQWEAPVVFVTGLTEGRFPRLPREDLFLMDRERRRVNESRGLSVRERRHEQDEELYLFYVAATRARSRIYLTRPATDGAGEELMPSVLLTDLLSAVEDPRGVVVSERPLSRTLPLVSEFVGEDDLRCYALLFLSEPYLPGTPGEARARRAAALHNLLVGDAGYRETIALATRFLTPPAAAIREIHRLADRHPAGGAVSPTALEEFVDCPFRHFAHRTLRIEAAPGRFRDAFDSRTLGAVAHRALQRVFGRVVAGDELPAPGEVRGIFDAACTEVAGRGPESIIEGRALDAVLDSVLRLVEVERERLRGESFRPLHLEEWFGEGDRRVVVRAADGRRAELVGCPDRIDVSPDGRAVVIDYKLSRGFGSSARRGVEDGVRFQLPVYLLAVRDAFGLEPAGAWLYSIRDAAGGGYVVEGGPEPWKRMAKLTTAGLEEMLDGLRSRILDVVDDIRSGRIDVDPRAGACKHCDFGDLCRVEPWRLPEDRS